MDLDETRRLIKAARMRTEARKTRGRRWDGPGLVAKAAGLVSLCFVLGLVWMDQPGTPPDWDDYTYGYTHGFGVFIQDPHESRACNQDGGDPLSVRIVMIPGSPWRGAVEVEDVTATEGEEIPAGNKAVVVLPRDVTVEGLGEGDSVTPSIPNSGTSVVLGNGIHDFTFTWTSGPERRRLGWGRESFLIRYHPWYGYVGANGETDFAVTPAAGVTFPACRKAPDNSSFGAGAKGVGTVRLGVDLGESHSTFIAPAPDSPAEGFARVTWPAPIGYRAPVEPTSIAIENNVSRMTYEGFRGLGTLILGAVVGWFFTRQPQTHT